MMLRLSLAPRVLAASCAPMRAAWKTGLPWDLATRPIVIVRGFSAARAEGAAVKAAAGEPGIEVIEDDGRDDDRADDDLAVVLVDTENHDAAGNHLDNQRAQNHTEGRAAASGEAGATDDGGGDDVELVALAVARGGGAVIAEREQCRDAGAETADEVDAELHALHADAAKTRGEFVATHCVDAAARGEAG